MIGLAAPALAAFLAALALVPVCRAAARRLGMVAAVTPDRWRPRPTPLLGGVAVGGTVLGLLPLLGAARPLWALMAAAGAMGVLGVVDDRRPLRPSAKLAVEIAVASGLLLAGYRLHWVDSLTVDTMLTLLWIVGITNAVNFLDNMDGLCAGVAVIAAAGLVASGAGPSDPAGVYLALLAGAAAAFLVFNAPPASVFLGDSGSLFLGVSLAAVTLAPARAAAAAADPLAAIAVPVLVLLVPIVDTTLVTVLRPLAGRGPADGGRDHASHRLVTAGLSERRTVAVLWGLAAAGGAIGVLLHHAPLAWALPVGVVFVLAVIILAVYLARVRVDHGTTGRLAPAGTVLRAAADVVVRTRAAEVLLDACLVAVAYYAAYRLRFEGAAWGENFPLFLESLPIVIGVQVSALAVMGAYRTVWWRVGLIEGVLLARCVAAGTAATVIVLLLAYRFVDYSRTVFVVHALLLLLLVVAFRSSFRLIDEFVARRRDTGRTVVVYGAHDAGIAALEEAAGSLGAAFRMVGFIDDDAAWHGRRVQGYPVLGGYDALAARLRAGTVDTVVLHAAIEDDRLADLTRVCAAADAALLQVSVEVRCVVAGRSGADGPPRPA